MEVSRSLEAFDRVIFESPVPQKRLDWYRLLRNKIPQPIALHLNDLQHLLAALREDAADYYNLLGPLKEFTEWAKMAQASGCPTWRGTGCDFGIRDMSSVHCAAATENFLVLENHAVDHPHWNNLVTGLPNPIIQNGYIDVPESPGLGIDLNEGPIRSHLHPDHPGYFEPTPEWDSEQVNDRLWS